MVDNTWMIVEEQIKNEKRLFENQINRKPRAIRVFVSSTFTDFFSEREILIKQVKQEIFIKC
jgi:hypothetical protein